MHKESTIQNFPAPAAMNIKVLWNSCSFQRVYLVNNAHGLMCTTLPDPESMHGIALLGNRLTSG